MPNKHIFPRVGIQVFDSATMNQRSIILNAQEINISVKTRSPGICEVFLENGNSFTPETSDVIQISMGSFTSIFAGVFLSERVTYSEKTGITRVLVFVDGLGALQWLHNAYFANTSNKTIFQSTDTHSIAQQVVANNTSSGTTGNGRVRDSDFPFIHSLASVPTSATNIDYSCAWRNVFSITKELCEIGNHDITTNVNEGTNQLIVQIEGDPVGSTKNIYLSEASGNIREIDSISTDLNHRSVAIVGGAGQQSNRVVRTRTGSTYIVDEHGKESFVDARHTEDNSELDALGDSFLEEELVQQDDIYDLYFRDDLSLFGSAATDIELGDTVYLNGVQRRITGIDISLSMTPSTKIHVAQA